MSYLLFVQPLGSPHHPPLQHNWPSRLLRFFWKSVRMTPCTVPPPPPSTPDSTTARLLQNHRPVRAQHTYLPHARWVIWHWCWVLFCIIHYKNVEWFILSDHGYRCFNSQIQAQITLKTKPNTAWHFFFFFTRIDHIKLLLFEIFFFFFQTKARFFWHLKECMQIMQMNEL